MKVATLIAALSAPSTLAFGFMGVGTRTAIIRTAGTSRGGVSMMAKKKKEVVQGLAHGNIKDWKINPSGAALAKDGWTYYNYKTLEVIQQAPQVAKPKAKATNAEVGTMELYCKAGPDGKSLGDCPFTQYVSMVLTHKKIPYNLMPTAPDDKPDWLVEDYEGKMPCLVHDDEAYTESTEIVNYLEFFFPEIPLNPKETRAEVEKVLSVAQPLFPALAKCIKNLDKEQDPELVAAVVKALGELDSLLGEEGGKYLAGDNFTLADCSVAPKLYHAKTALAQFKNTIIPPEMEALSKYMETIFAHPTFVATKYAPDVAVWGWNNARGTEAK